MNIQCIFFDLDNTLWDFSASSQLALTDIYKRYIKSYGIREEDWRIVYSKHNEELWKQYRQGKVDSKGVKIQRFARAFGDLGLTNQDYTQISEEYLECLVTNTVLFPNVVETLRILNERYTLGVITNGFAASTQRLSTLGLDKFFACLVTSEAAGVPKPHIEIFSQALHMVQCTAECSAYVGDDYETDVVGAKNAGLKAVLFNHKGLDIAGKNPQPDHIVSSFEGLKDISWISYSKGRQARD